MKKLFLMFFVIALAFVVTACKPEPEPEPENNAPVLAGITDANIKIGDEFDELAGITATDEEDGDITSSIVVTGTWDVNVAGTYTINYSVTDSEGEKVTGSRSLTVSEVDLVFPTGFFNHKFSNTDLRHTFMAAAESFLMNNMYAGVPLFANGSFMLYSARLQLPVSEFVAVMGFGTSFATMSHDDSHVTMDDGEPGNVGEYTFRSALSTNPDSLNQWTYTDSVSAAVLDLFLGTLYAYEFNADKTGYVVVPSMASTYPTPMDAETLDGGKEVAKTWQISLRDDLEWTYHADTDISGFPAGHEVINAHDYVDTFKLALDQGWFRAISGGGDFLSETQQIVNAQEYLDGEAEWAEVGIRVIDDLTFEFEFANDMSEWNVKYWLSSFVMSPINIHLFESLQDGEVNTFGTSAETVAFHGPFTLDVFEQDKVLRYTENTNYHNPDRWFFTHYVHSVIPDADLRFQNFIDGRLESASLPPAKFDEFKNHPGIMRAPGATTFRIMINGFGTVEALNETFPETDFIPEPILATHDFKMAMFFAIDRQYLAETVLKTSTTQMYLFSDAYLVDPELGIPYRSTPQGMTVSEGLSPSTFGFNFDAAQAHFRLAVAEMVAAGNYTGGTAENPVIIDIEFLIFSGSEAQVLMGAYLETAFEAALQCDVHHVQVNLEIVPKQFPGIYFNYMMIGKFDLSIGGISGSTLDAASFLDTYSSDNRSGFTLNWGIDTSVANIEVLFHDHEGNRHRQMWSFDAISSVLVGEVYVLNGEEATVPAARDFEHTPSTVTFTIDLFDSLDFQNITFTVQTYDLVTGSYVDVPGWVDIVPTSATVTVDGLLPGYPWGIHPETNANEYRGDYQVVINFTYTVDPDREGGETISEWWLQPAIIETKDVVATQTDATINIVLADDPIARIVTGATVYVMNETTEEYEVVTGAVVDFTDLTAVTVTGLTAGTDYIVIFDFDDNNDDFVKITTEAIPE